ncbi:MAG: hypothetical protein ACPGU9_03915 [Flavobacteriaceae bacterium]
MKTYAFLMIFCLVYSTAQAQTIEEIKQQNNSEINDLKKEYYKKLQDDQDARIFTIAQEREIYTYQKLKQRQHQANINFKNDSAARKHLSIEKQKIYDIKLTRYQDSIENAIGYRRVSKAIAEREKKRKAKELEAAQKREAFYRSQAVAEKKNVSENDLKQKINSRHQALKKKYTVKE